MNLLQKLIHLQEQSGSGNQTVTTVTGLTGEALRLLNWVIQADLAIQSEVTDWKFLWKAATSPITTGAGTRDYPAVSDLNVWDRESFCINGEFLPKAEDFNRQTFPKTAASGPPSQVFIMPDNSIRLYPTPDQAYEIEYDYWRKPVEMPVDNDSASVIPSQFHWAIVYEALNYYATFEDAPEAAEKAKIGLQTWYPKLEASQKPNHGYGTVSDGNNIEVIAE